MQLKNTCEATGLAVPLAGSIAESMMSLLPLRDLSLSLSIFFNLKESLGDSTGKKELKLVKQHFRVVSNYINISFFLAFTETYDLATLVDNPIQLPRLLTSHVTLSLPKFQPNILPLHLPVQSFCLARHIQISQPFHFRSSPCQTWNNFNNCYMLLLTCSHILEYFNAFSSSSLKTGIEIRLWLFLRNLAVEVVVLEEPWRAVLRSFWYCVGGPAVKARRRFSFRSS